MNTIQLKQELIHRISRIEDIDFLNAIKTILDYKKKESFIELTADQEKEPEQMHEQIIKSDLKNEMLLKEIELLREQNQELKKDKEILNQRLQESNIIQLKTIESFKQIEYKQEQEQNKSWWQRLFIWVTLG